MRNLGNRHSQHSFAKIPDMKMARSKFNRSFASKDTFDFDELVPLFVDEVLPGDTINLNVKSFCRLATQVVPILDNMYIDYFFFFVPNRLVWDNWEKFNGAQDNPGDSTDYLVPVVESGSGADFEVGSIFDHMGIPTGVNDIEVNALPLRAYNLIYNDWFRDQNLIDSITVNKDDGPDPASDYTLKKRAKKHDYFTSALPWPQKGDSVALPLGTSAPVYGNELTGNTGGTLWQAYNGSAASQTEGTLFIAGTGSSRTVAASGSFNDNATSANPLSLGSKEGYDANPSYTAPYADLSEATAATINELRNAFMVQSLLELDARGGTRYVEILRSHFNVTSPDFRLQRPEFLSGGSTSINQHPVAQTSSTDATSPQGNLAAFSTSSVGNVGFSKSFTEHGYVLGLIQARGEVTYQQGLERMWSRQTRWDFFWPKLQELGEQAIYNKEIYMQGTTDDDDVFGYQERFAEYRYKPSQIKGQFRSTYAESLDVWHLAEEFSSLPALNETFINSTTPIERVLTVDAGYPHLLGDFWFDYKHARPMMTYGVPATLGRF